MKKENGTRLGNYFRQSFDIQSRTTRKDYWLTSLQVILIFIFLGLASIPLAIVNPMFLSIIYIFSIIQIPASVTLLLRRYRDLGVHPVYMFLLSIILGLVTFGASYLLFLIFLCLKSNALYDLAPNWLKLSDIELDLESDLNENIYDDVELELDREEEKIKEYEKND